MSSEVDPKASSDWHALEPLLPCPFCGVSLEMSGQIVQYLRHPLRSIEEAHCPGAHVAIEFAPEPDHHRAAMWNRRSASPSIGRVGVGALEWFGQGWPKSAVTPFGTYRVWAGKDVWFDDRQIFHDGAEHAPDEATAKSWAQADYDARILSTLVSHEETAGDTQGALAVRPLKWEPAGRYPFVAMSDYYDIGHQSGDGRYWVHHRIFGDLREGDGTIEHHLTLDAAKAAAQEDHERKILWQIVGSSDPDVAPPNVEHLHPLADREKSAALVSPPDNGEPGNG